MMLWLFPLGRDEAKGIVLLFLVLANLSKYRQEAVFDLLRQSHL